MHDLDIQVITQALAWAHEGHSTWLCTVLSTHGSSPRAPGAMLVARRGGHHVGSLSGGCVEEAFLERLDAGGFERPVTIRRYGESQEERQRFALPCGGVLEVLIEHRSPDAPWVAHLEMLQLALLGQRRLKRRVDVESGAFRACYDNVAEGPCVVRRPASADIRIGPVLRLLLAGLSPVAEACAHFAQALGHEVIVCDPRPEAREGFSAEGVTVVPQLPSTFIAAGGCHAATAVVALTHDPRIDDLAMIEAVRTEAFYIGVMGSRRTSDARATRLLRSGGLTQVDIDRIHMPIGLDIGSKAPAEIALAVVADIVRVYHGKARDAL
ncbi:XdhC family protein [Billgrantia endophytica]|uniref:XshC-Cox1 family protein n=1 Tax=Billgrantia endophytica TaxID=2033802 RepID=A0A2N7U833_9GAMM|nr:XdhC family protein [Halomonas endophytica]PMR76591.1 XshC-Cox1 family protein [Halomonas endophytica]